MNRYSRCSISNQDPKTPEAWAFALLRLWGMNFPVKPEQIALEYSQQRFKGDPITAVTAQTIEGFEGALLKSPQHSRWYILYTPRPTLPGRESFTIAHELGHYLQHRKSADRFECGQEDVLDEDGYRYRQREKEVNTFASYLLMPMNDFREQINGQRISLDLLGHCADRYRVSFIAAALKWLAFTQDIAMLVVARDGFALWSKSSSRAKQKHLLWRSGRAVPEHALISQCLTAGRTGPVVHPPGVWSYYDPTTEMAIVSDRYDLQVALVLYPDTSTGPNHCEPEPADAYDFYMSKN